MPLPLLHPADVVLQPGALSRLHIARLVPQQLRHLLPLVERLVGEHSLRDEHLVRVVELHVFFGVALRLLQEEPAGVLLFFFGTFFVLNEGRDEL